MKLLQAVSSRLLRFGTGLLWRVRNAPKNLADFVRETRVFVKEKKRWPSAMQHLSKVILSFTAFNGMTNLIINPMMANAGVPDSVIGHASSAMTVGIFAGSLILLKYKNARIMATAGAALLPVVGVYAFILGGQPVITGTLVVLIIVSRAIQGFSTSVEGPGANDLFRRAVRKMVSSREPAAGASVDMEYSRITGDQGALQNVINFIATIVALMILLPFFGTEGGVGRIIAIAVVIAAPVGVGLAAALRLPADPVEASQVVSQEKSRKLQEKKDRGVTARPAGFASISGVLGFTMGSSAEIVSAYAIIYANRASHTGIAILVLVVAFARVVGRIIGTRVPRRIPSRRVRSTITACLAINGGSIALLWVSPMILVVFCVAVTVWATQRAGTDLINRMELAVNKEEHHHLAVRLPPIIRRLATALYLWEAGSLVDGIGLRNLLLLTAVIPLVGIGILFTTKEYRPAFKG